MNWKQHLKAFTSFIEEAFHNVKDKPGPFRFGLPVISTSDIAQQYYCEKKVEMQFLLGEVETPEKIIGDEAHKKLLEDTVKTTQEELWQTIYSKKPILVFEMYLLARFNDSIVGGRPDTIAFKNGRPFFLFEYKFGRTHRPFKNHHVQARTYGMLLNKMGFDTSQLYYAIVLARPEARHDHQFKQKVITAVTENGLKEAEIPLKDAQIYITQFDLEKAHQDLEWAIEFWKNMREAISTQNPNKCKSCVYTKECDQSLVLFEV